MSLRTASIRRRGPDAGSAALWASAFVIAALIIVRLGGAPPAGPEARAGLVADAAGLTVLTAFNGDSEDIILVLDSRNERLNVYTVRNRQSIELEAAYDLVELFTQARAAAGGRRR